MSDKEPCPSGCYFKSSAGTVHLVNRGGEYSPFYIDSYVSSNLMSPPVRYRTVAEFFGVSHADISRHPAGRLTDDRFLSFL